MLLAAAYGQTLQTKKQKGVDVTQKTEGLLFPEYLWHAMTQYRRCALEKRNDVPGYQNVRTSVRIERARQR